MSEMGSATRPRSLRGLGLVAPAVRTAEAVRLGPLRRADRLRRATSHWAPGAHAPGSTDRMMDSDELRSVRERSLDLHLVDHLGHAFHDVVAPEDRLPGGHQLGNGATVTD